MGVGIGGSAYRGTYAARVAQMSADGLVLAALVRQAMALAAEAGERGDPPFGALLVDAAGAVVARASNRQVSGDDPTAHSEIELLRVAARAGHRPPLDGYTLVVNAEPCSMCASAIVKAAPSTLVYGASHEPHMDPDLGVADVFARARRPPRVIAGILADESASQIASFRSGSPAID
jgi:tRNA(adenine34) deaminase